MHYVGNPRLRKGARLPVQTAALHELTDACGASKPVLHIQILTWRQWHVIDRQFLPQTHVMAILLTYASLPPQTHGHLTKGSLRKSTTVRDGSGATRCRNMQACCDSVLKIAQMVTSTTRTRIARCVTWTYSQSEDAPPITSSAARHDGEATAGTAARAQAAELEACSPPGR